MENYQKAILEGVFGLIDTVERNRVEWESSFEAASAAASNYAKLTEDLSKASDAYGAQLALDAKAGVGPLVGIAATSDAFKMALKAAIANAPHLAELRAAVDEALRQRDHTQVELEIATARLRGSEVALRAVSRLANMFEG